MYLAPGSKEISQTSVFPLDVGMENAFHCANYGQAVYQHDGNRLQIKDRLSGRAGHLPDLRGVSPSSLGPAV